MDQEFRVGLCDQTSCSGEQGGFESCLPLNPMLNSLSLPLIAFSCLTFSVVAALIERIPFGSAVFAGGRWSVEQRL